MRSLMLIVLISFVGATALAQVPDQTKDKAESTTVAAAKEKQEDEQEFKPPPGFLPKKRGDKVVYCKKERPIGTRFNSETCFDEAQLRAYLIARDQANRDFEQRRAVCANPAVCSP